MRTYLYRPAVFVTFLLVCLMFAPARLVIGDREIHPTPSRAPSDDLLIPPSIEQSFAELCKNDPIGALARSMHRYKQEVEGYTCIMAKQERINGTLNKPEVIRCDVRESPFSFYLYWVEGRARAHSLLYPAEGRNDRLAIVPGNEVVRKVMPYVTRSLDDKEVRAQSRYPITQSGMNTGLARAHAAMIVARDQGMLKTRYDGIRPIPELGGKLCHVLYRDSDIPEEDGQTHLMLCFDVDNLMQVGAVVHAGNELVATYFFRDVVLNPRFEPGRFSIDRIKSAK